MGKFICTKRCYRDGRLWDPIENADEYLESDLEEVPHFARVDTLAKVDAKKVEVGSKAKEIKKALIRLNPNDDGHWTKTGLPQVRFVEELSGVPNLTRAMIEMAYPGFNRDSDIKPISQIPVKPKITDVMG